MRRTIAAALAASLVAAPAAAFDGTYGEVCEVVGDMAPVIIEGDIITFYESACQLTNPVSVRDMDGAVLFDMQCSGEGEVWTERVFLQPGWDGGLIFVSRGFAEMLPRCD